jgi:hypothetical protein
MSGWITGTFDAMVRVFEFFSALKSYHSVVIACPEEIA